MRVGHNTVRKLGRVQDFVGPLFFIAQMLTRTSNGTFLLAARIFIFY